MSSLPEFPSPVNPTDRRAPGQMSLTELRDQANHILGKLTGNEQLAALDFLAGVFALDEAGQKLGLLRFCITRLEVK